MFVYFFIIMLLLLTGIERTIHVNNVIIMIHKSRSMKIFWVFFSLIAKNKFERLDLYSK